MVTKLRKLVRRVRRRLWRRPARTPAAPPPPYVEPAPPGPGRRGGEGAVGVRRDSEGHVVVRLPDGAERIAWVAAWSDLPSGLADQLATCRATRWASQAGAGRAEGADPVARAVSAALGGRP